MEFITVDQFIKQPKEVQKVFLDWWQPSIGDLFSSDVLIGMGVITSSKFNKDGYIPLLTEGQIRKFIEEKTDSKIETVIGNRGYCFVFRLKNSRWEKDRISIVTDDLLQAYWKVACKIALEN